MIKNQSSEYQQNNNTKETYHKKKHCKMQFLQINYGVFFMFILLKLLFIPMIHTSPSDITSIVFGNLNTEGIIAAFGDFNSDEYTDVFMISNGGKTLEVLLGYNDEPLLRRSSNLKCTFNKLIITSIIPGDFDGDAFMDLMITTKTDASSPILDIYINWGAPDYLNCTNENNPPIIKTYGEPMALDYNRDMIIDLFGLNTTQQRMFWVFGNDRNKEPDVSPMDVRDDKITNKKLMIPHSHAYLDLNNDFTADLFITAEDHFEIWLGLEKESFHYHRKIDLPTGKPLLIGQSLFLDIELKGNMNQIIPVCYDKKSENSALLVYYNNHFHDIHVNFKDNNNVVWGFLPPKADAIYMNAITLRGGDFNMDGYPDLLATLVKTNVGGGGGGDPQTFFLENIPCPADQKTLCNSFNRTFQIRWKALAPFSNGTIMGAFYDFYQDGILDVIFVEKSGDKYRPKAFRNTLDYDANFVKVIVLTGLTNKQAPTKLTPLGRKKRTYGTNLPGPRITYYTTTQDGDIQHGSSAQIPQSGYFSLQLPYTIFGLGRTPNFVDSVSVGLSNHSRIWSQLIPNSQMIVIPWPPEQPSKWKAQLFVTPSKLIMMSVIALGGTCVIIMFIIFGLYIKEKREDKIEKLQEAHRFHFDAM